MKSKVKNTKEKKSHENSLVNKTTSEITEINKSLNKSIRIKMRENPQNSSENIKNENTNDSKTNINRSLNYINRAKMNSSFHHQKKPKQKNQNNLSFHQQKHSSKSKNNTKKEELQYLLSQLQKFTPEINLLLKKDKDEKKASPHKTSAILFKKKKKSHHSSKKPKKLQLEIKKADEAPSLNNTILREKMHSCKNNNTLNKIINEKNKRLALEKLLQKQKEDKIQQIKQEKVSSLLKMNEKIRKTNKKRFTSVPKNKNIEYFSQDHQKKLLKKISGQKKKRSKKSTEKERREELGLSWLNNMQQTQYLRVIERNRSKSRETKNDKSIDFISSFLAFILSPK